MNQAEHLSSWSSCSGAGTDNKRGHMQHQARGAKCWEEKGSGEEESMTRWSRVGETILDGNQGRAFQNDGVCAVT